MDLLTWQETAITDAETMTREEAEIWASRVGSAANELRVLLFEGHERKAWLSLGYHNWTECIQSLAEKYGFSERHMWRMHVANETEKLLTNWSVGESPKIPESQLRPLTSLPVESQPIAWQRAVETAPDGKITAAHVQAVVDEIQNKPHVSFNSGNNEWYTPAEYIEAARRVMGEIDLDPASSEVANQTVRARVYFTAEDDGLRFSWDGRVWMNPPYSGDLIGKFTEKLVSHYANGDVTEAIVLVNNATETAWFQTMLECADVVCFVRRRIRYLDATGNPANSPLQGQAILYLGENLESFRDEFEKFGACLYG